MALILKDTVQENGTHYLQMLDCEEYLIPSLTSETVLLIGNVEFGDYGYERKSDWMRLINKVDNYKADAFFKKLIPSVKGEYTVKYNYGSVEIIYDKPIKVALAVVGDKFAVEEITQIKGEITWEWYSSSCESHKVLEGYCGILEVGLRDVKFN